MSDATAATGATVAVAFSGGRDSLALLHATCRAAAALGLQVVALHVHHGLQPQADDWVRRAQGLCARWRRKGWPLRLRWGRLEGQPAPGDSVEAWARAGRYELLHGLALEEGASLLLVAQHRRDQAETVLLQALRGAGAAGLSAMPKRSLRQGLTWARPWLDKPREAIDAYVRHHRLKPMEDPSNADPRWARNRLRLQVWPVLQAAFVDAEVALAAVADHAQASQAALDELAALDLAGCTAADGALRVADWRCLSPARQANALRAWWLGQTGAGMPAALLHRLLAEVPTKGSARWPAGRGRECVLFRGCLSAGLASQDGRSASASPGKRCASVVMDLSRPGRWPAAGWPGFFLVEPSASGGIACEDLQTARIAPRSGGERFKAHAAGSRRGLKQQFQAAGVPPDQRDGPLVWSTDRLLYVAALGADARALAPAGCAQVRLLWCPDGAMSASPKAAG